MTVASMNSDPFLSDDRSTKAFQGTFDLWQSTHFQTQYWNYCAIAVPKHEYESTPTFDVQSYMLQCMQKGKPVKVYIGKCTRMNCSLSKYHTDARTCLMSSIGKSILSNEYVWFHVTSLQFRSSDDTKKAEVLAQFFVNWRCHHAINTKSGFHYIPGWSTNETETFRTLTTDQDKLGLLRIFKDTVNFQLFCKASLKGKCNRNHDKPIQVVKGRPHQRLLFNANWHITEKCSTPIKLRFNLTAK
jgi:hypothetical protein